MLMARLLEPQPGELVADACAAPGTKTTHLAQLMDNRGRILAIDPQAARLGLLTAGGARLGVTIVEAHAGGVASVVGALDRTAATACWSTRRARTSACCAAIPR